MGEANQHLKSVAEQFNGGFEHSFTRLLDINLPSAPSLVQGFPVERQWSWHQTVSFASLVSLSLWAFIAGAIYFLA